MVNDKQVEASNGPSETVERIGGAILGILGCLDVMLARDWLRDPRGELSDGDRQILEEGLRKFAESDELEDWLVRLREEAHTSMAPVLDRLSKITLAEMEQERTTQEVPTDADR